MLLSEGAGSELAVGLRNGGAPIGVVFEYVSSLYFRGKLAYSQTFASPPAGVGARYVITPGFGLMVPETVISIDHIRAMAEIPIEDARFREPFERDARLLRAAVGADCDVVLLGSVASPKYTEPLLEVFGSRLLFPAEFVGRGDMSRGGLMLRCAREGRELEYSPVLGAVVRGKRPPRLPKPSRQSDIVMGCG